MPEESIETPDAAPVAVNTDAGAGADEQRLIEYLSHHECECPLCGYNLRHLTKSICPECGHGLTLTVGIADMLLWPWASMAVSACLCAGLGLMCVFMVLLDGMPPRLGPDAIWITRNITIYLFMAAIPVAIAVVVNRRHILKMLAALQKTLAWISITVCVTLFATFFITMALSLSR